MRNGIIAFCGSKGSGKSTSATIFKDNYKGPTEELAFAGHLKKVCSETFSIDMKYFLDPKLKEVELQNYVTLRAVDIKVVFNKFDITDFDYDKHIRPHMGQVFDTPRQLLQYVGTEVLHPLDPLIHVKMTLKNKDSNKLSIITDLRFSQEFNSLKTRSDFLPVYVYNVKAENSAQSDTHASEQQLKLFKEHCEKMDNNGDLGDLTRSVVGLIDKFYGKVL